MISDTLNSAKIVIFSAFFLPAHLKVVSTRVHAHAHTRTHARTHSFSQDTLDSVEALIKKHEDFGKLLEAQEEKVNAVDDFAQNLMAAEHY